MVRWVVGKLESNTKLNSKSKLKLKLKLELSLAKLVLYVPWFILLKSIVKLRIQR